MADKSFLVNRVLAERITTIPTRSFIRLESEGVIVPKKRGGPGKASIYDLAVIVPAVITHLKAQSARQAEQVARARREQSQAELNELKLAERRRELLPTDQVERHWSAIASTIRNGVLGIPTRAKQRIPSLTRGDVKTLTTLVREILEELAAHAHDA